MKPPNPSRPSMRSVVIGILLVARGRADGLRLFGDTSQSVLSGLAPLGAFLLVGVVAALVGHDRETLTDLLSVSIGFLGPLVLSFEVARRWNRAAQWRRFATAFCWCQWAAPLALAVVLILMAIMMTVGIQPEIAAGVGVALMFAYAVWLNWFLARHALELTPLRAVALVVIVNFLTIMLILVPQVVSQMANGAPAP
ncbi:hypothetical protein [Acidisphaera sp. L21]|uniref:hypothetical protein n=1 Tax=Acidisphaera sp. L21 TaxID=1641851 RepID=UPI00131CE1BB|nr:hypothetical protein [Acidisphaera sp. L21]